MQLLSPAKINLFLKVIGKRPDGYHDLVSLMCGITLFDNITVDIGGAGIAVSCNDPDVPTDESNLVCRAVRVFQKAAGLNEGVRIDIRKHVPVGAGLGGGSSNAAALLTGLNEHYGFPLSTDNLRSLGATIGADVPFFIDGKPAIATGIGEKLELFGGMPDFHLVLINPGFLVSTAEIFKKLKIGLTNSAKKPKRDLLIDQKFDVASHLCNDLETVTSTIYPDIAEVKAALIAQGAEGALMSGSGPTVFGLFSDSKSAERAKNNLAGRTGWRVFTARVLR